jgi:putative ABC transport system permease protein
MIIKAALKSLMANKLRSVLAMLGIIIGVGAVIAMLAIGAGTQKAVLDQFSAMGTNLLVVRPGQSGAGGVNSGTRQNLTLDDAKAILNDPQVRSAGGVKSISPVVGGNAQVKYLSSNTHTSVQGVAVTYFPIRDYQIDSGAMFTEQDSDHDARVAVLGPVTAENLFGSQDPIGQTIKLNGDNFQVVGVTKSKGDQGFYNPDDQILIPYTTAMKLVFGNAGPIANSVREIDVQAADDANLDNLQSAILSVLRTRHRIQAGAPDDVNIRNQADILAQRSEATDRFTFLLAGTATISLLVGGIGIMNIMLVTVTERTREIGIRKAIGASNSDILRQFLIEAVLMSGLGGLIGLLAGVGTAMLLNTCSTQFPTVIQANGILLALGFSAAVGIFFGYYPATRAARLDPIEALRYE